MRVEHSLISDPLIDVAMLDGGRERVGLRELLLRAGEIADLEIPVPPAAAGMWRVLYTVAARVTGLGLPDDLGPWQAERRNVLKQGGFDQDEVERYLAGVGERFFLRGPRPFLQDPRLAEQCTTASGLNKLIFSRPSGNNHAWWQHASDEQPAPIEPREALWWLLAQLYYGASGQCTPRTVDGQRFGNSYAGPLRSAISFHPLGRTLFESLVLGIPAPTSDDDENDAWWETELADPLQPGTPAVDGADRAVRGTGSLLTGRFSHAMLLVWDEDKPLVTDAYLTWGRRSPVEAVDPYVIRNISQQGTTYDRPASADRALWRDLDALLREGTDGTRRPQVFAQLGSLTSEQRAGLRVRAYGFDQDGQVNNRQYFSAVTPPSFTYLDPESAKRLRDCRLAAENTGRRLALAAKTAWFESASSLGAPPDRARSGPWTGRALAAYWPAAEKVFWAMIDDPDSTGSPYRQFVQVALRTIEDVAGTASSAPSGAKALNHAKAILLKLLSDPSPVTKEEA